MTLYNTTVKNVKNNTIKNEIILYSDIIFFSLFIPGSLYVLETFSLICGTQISIFSLILYYLFHIIFDKQDFLHNLHHYIVIIHHILIAFVFHSYLTRTFVRIMFIQYIMLISSIFSALRKLAIKNNWEKRAILEKIYFYTFLTLKILGNVFTWILWLYFEMYNNSNLAILIHQYLVVYFVGIIQLYLSYKVYKKLRLNNMS